MPKLQRLHRWSLGMAKLLHPTLYNRCDYLSTLGLKVIVELAQMDRRNPDYCTSLNHWSYDGCDAIYAHCDSKGTLINQCVFTCILRHNRWWPCNAQCISKGYTVHVSRFVSSTDALTKDNTNFKCKGNSAHGDWMPTTQSDCWYQIQLQLGLKLTFVN